MLVTLAAVTAFNAALQSVSKPSVLQVLKASDQVSLLARSELNSAIVQINQKSFKVEEGKLVPIGYTFRGMPLSVDQSGRVYVLKEDSISSKDYTTQETYLGERILNPGRLPLKLDGFMLFSHCLVQLATGRSIDLKGSEILSATSLGRPESILLITLSSSGSHEMLNLSTRRDTVSLAKVPVQVPRMARATGVATVSSGYLISCWEDGYRKVSLWRLDHSGKATVCLHTESVEEYGGSDDVGSQFPNLVTFKGSREYLWATPGKLFHGRI